MLTETSRSSSRLPALPSPVPADLRGSGGRLICGVRAARVLVECPRSEELSEMTMNRGLSRWASGLGVLLVAGSIQAGQPAPPIDRWTARTPDEMLDLALRRAERPGDGAMAGLALAYSLADRASAGRARKGLEALSRPDDDIATQARWLAAELDPNPGATPPGLLRGWVALGPFQDTGGGLTRHEGPEATGQVWGDPGASYAWGAYE